MKKPLGRLFDPKAPLSVTEHSRPHWSQAGTIVIITFRTADSIPKDILDRWKQDKISWLKTHANITITD